MTDKADVNLAIVRAEHEIRSIARDIADDPHSTVTKCASGDEPSVFVTSRLLEELNRAVQTLRKLMATKETQ